MDTLYDALKAHQNNKKDKRVFGLVLQGGGMRASYSAGAIVPLIHDGFSDAFDHVIGSSAGAINGAYFLGADAETFKTYTDDLTNKNFVNILRREKKVDIDYLVDLVLKHKPPVNIENLRKSRSKLHVVLTDAATGKKFVTSDHALFENIYEEFRATAALPLLYDKKIAIGDRFYIDGGISDLLPIDVAIELGCTDIVVVMTQQLSFYHFDKAHSRLVKHLVKRFAKKYSKQLQRKLPTDERLLKINIRRLTHPTKKIRFYVLEPSEEEFLIGMATTDKSKVEILAKLGISDMESFLYKELGK